MKLSIKNKTIDNKKYYVFDGIINGITIDSISEIKKIETAFNNTSLIFLVDDVEHHIYKNDLEEVLATFYDENWNQLSYDEIDITNEILKQSKELEELL